jgi:hypothetical protein
MPINRRKFLKQSTIAVAGISLARLPIISATVAPKKVIIIGAGMAGLSAGFLAQAVSAPVDAAARAKPD